METVSSGALFAVVAVPSPLVTGATFSRAVWPAHVTLALTFSTEASVDELAEFVRQACSDVGPMTITVDGAALFGRDHDIPVQLVSSRAVVDLHERLADVLTVLPGFEADEPDHWRTGFRPHVTHVAGRITPEGAELVLRHIALAEIDGPSATVVDAFPLSAI